MNAKPLFAIIIPFESIERDKYVFDCIRACLNQSFSDFEIILLPNKKIPDSVFEKEFGKASLKKIRCIATGEKLKTGRISAKRNLGIRSTKAKFVALVDSDAYPEKQWLASSVEILKDDKVGIVGGPTLAPANIGFVEESIIKTLPLYTVSTGLRYRMKKYLGCKIFDDVPTCNLITKRNLMLRVGMFDERYFTGEDTLFCRQIRKLGKLILFNDRTIVHHHNRLLLGHISRMRMFGACKVRLLRELNEFPLMNLLLAMFFVYFIASIFFIIAFLFIIPPLITGTPLVGIIISAPFLLYFFVIAIDCLLNSVEPFRLPFCMFIVFLTHLAYGFGSLEGFIFKKLSFRFT
jgi:GT2 family glycosyltransferase